MIVFYTMETCCLTVSECTQTSVCISPHSWHLLGSPFEAVPSVQVGPLSKLQLKTHPPSPGIMYNIRTSYFSMFLPLTGVLD